ncbi:MAG: transcription-repair coupling factor [Phycisphaerales bacterium]
MRTGTAHLDLLVSSPALAELSDRLQSGGHRFAHGVIGSSTRLVAAAAAQNTGRPLLLVVAHIDEADDAADELASVGIEASVLPALEVLPGESAVSLDLFARRLALVRQIHENRQLPRAIIAPIQSLMQGVPRPERLAELTLTISAGSECPPDRLLNWLSSAGYQRLDSIEEPGDFAVRGGIVDIFPPPGGASTKPAGTGESLPFRLDFFGDEIESITEIDLDTMGSDRRLDRVDLVGTGGLDGQQAILTGDEVNALDLLGESEFRSAIVVLSDTMEVTEQARGYYERVINAKGIDGPPEVLRRLRSHFHAFCEINPFESGHAGDSVELPVSPLPEFPRDASDAAAELGKLTAQHRVIVCPQSEAENARCSELIREFCPPEQSLRIEQQVAYIHRGFAWTPPGGSPTLVIPYHELLHRFHTRRRTVRLRSSESGQSASETFLQLEPGDIVVHTEHGIARFAGLRHMSPRGPKQTAEQVAEHRIRKAQSSAGLSPAQQRREARRAAEGKFEAAPASEEFLTLEFANRSKLHVPVTQIDKVQKYVGGGGRDRPPLSVLGGKKWQAQKEHVKESVKDLAAEMLRVQAARESMPGIRYPADTQWQTEFEAEFPYEETEDQLSALSAIKRDMSRTQPMDRLLCGDVGYGKTEVAIRAAFKAAEFGKQVAVLVPTTILAEQHGRTFTQRFADYPFRVETINRFKTRQQQTEILKKVRSGQVDVLIGTHRILSSDVKFADLGLVIVDEEQKFGVEDKNRLLQLKLTVDVLTLSATPIPRTLHMSMLGLRDISSLSTPPQDRRAVVTEVIPYNKGRIKHSIERELAREGQIYFVHNRVHNIRSVADEVRKMAPSARVLIGHGQMPERELEEVMHKFMTRQADILVATTIIESGIDIPTANTMVINDAHMFGLADLHQLRGRVGRYKHRAYCYLLLPPDKPVPEVAKKRLKAIEEYSMLGAGFKIAMRDLEIRGTGNLLGAEQSGHISAVGYDMYCKLLDQATKELRGESTSAVSETMISIGVTGNLPKAYIPSDTRRLEAYRRLATADSLPAVDAIEQDLRQAYGDLPKQADRLVELARLRAAASALGIRAITVREQDVVFRTMQPSLLERAMHDAPGTLRLITGAGAERPADRSGRDQSVHEVFFRPPAQFLEPPTLLVMLRRRLAAVTAAGTPTEFEKA